MPRTLISVLLLAGLVAPASAQGPACRPDNAGLTLAPGTADEIRRLVLHGSGTEVGAAFRLDRYLGARH